jgi:hypothetical protein
MRQQRSQTSPRDDEVPAINVEVKAIGPRLFVRRE